VVESAGNDARRPVALHRYWGDMLVGYAALSGCAAAIAGISLLVHADHLGGSHYYDLLGSLLLVVGLAQALIIGVLGFILPGVGEILERMRETGGGVPGAPPLNGAGGDSVAAGL